MKPIIISDEALIAAWHKHSGDAEAIAAEVGRHRKNIAARLRALGHPVILKRTGKGTGRIWTKAIADDGDGIDRRLKRPWPESAVFGPGSSAGGG